MRKVCSAFCLWEITIIADGVDEKEAVDGLVDLILSDLNG